MKDEGQLRHLLIALREQIEANYSSSSERSLALTKLDECELWLGRAQ